MNGPEKCGQFHRRVVLPKLLPGRPRDPCCPDTVGLPRDYPLERDRDVPCVRGVAGDMDRGYPHRPGSTRSDAWLHPDVAIAVGGDRTKPLHALRGRTLAAVDACHTARLKLRCDSNQASNRPARIDQQHHGGQRIANASRPRRVRRGSGQRSLDHDVGAWEQPDDGMEQEASLRSERWERQGTLKCPGGPDHHQPCRPNVSLPERLAGPSRIDPHRLKLTWSLTAPSKAPNLFACGRIEAKVVIVGLRDDDRTIGRDGEMNDPGEVGHIAVDAEVVADRADRLALGHQWCGAGQRAQESQQTKVAEGSMS